MAKQVWQSDNGTLHQTEESALRDDLAWYTRRKYKRYRDLIKEHIKRCAKSEDVKISATLPSVAAPNIYDGVAARKGTQWECPERCTNLKKRTLLLIRDVLTASPKVQRATVWDIDNHQMAVAALYDLEPIHKAKLRIIITSLIKDGYIYKCTPEHKLEFTFTVAGMDYVRVLLKRRV